MTLFKPRESIKPCSPSRKYEAEHDFANLKNRVEVWQSRNFAEMIKSKTKATRHIISLEPYEPTEPANVCEMEFLSMHSNCSIADHDCERGHFPTHPHPQQEVIIILEGSMVFRWVNDDGSVKKQKTLGPTDIVCVAPNELHNASIEQRCRFLACVIPADSVNWPGPPMVDENDRSDA